VSTAPQALLPVIRPLAEPDLDAVLAIEVGSYPFPWTRGIFADCLRAGYSCFGVWLGARLAGYSVQNCNVGEAHLLNLCVGAGQRGRGLGRLLLDNAIRCALMDGAQQIFLEVRPSNRDAVALYRSAGFVEAGCRKGYYPAREGREDALVLRLALASSP